MSIFGQARLYDCLNKCFKDEYIHDILLDETGNVWYNGRIISNWIIVNRMDEDGIIKLFESVRFIDDEIKKAQIDLEEETKRRDSLKAAFSDGLPHGTDVSDPTYDITIEVLQSNQRIKKKANNLAALKSKQLYVEVLLDMLDEIEKGILVEKYINKNNWIDTADKVHFSEKATRNKALAALSKIKSFVA